MEGSLPLRGVGLVREVVDEERRRAGERLTHAEERGGPVPGLRAHCSVEERGAYREVMSTCAMDHVLGPENRQIV